MAANSKFKPKASANIVEGAVPVEEKVAPVEDVALTDTADEAVDSGENPETAPPAEVQFEDTQTKTAPERLVKVSLTENHTCSIGGERYHFVKGKQYNVPESVKTILKQAGLLMPL